MNICRVILDTRPIYNASGDPQENCKNKKPNLPVSFQTTSQICVVRYIGHPDQFQNDVYLEEWAIVVSRWIEEKRTVFFFVHCPEEEHSPNIAYQFYRKNLKCIVLVCETLSLNLIKSPSNYLYFSFPNNKVILMVFTYRSINRKKLIF